MHVIVVTDKDLYVKTASTFTADVNQALQLPRAIAVQLCDYMSERYYKTSAWNVVPR